jgi:autotransporter-associated beta strand protein
VGNDFATNSTNAADGLITAYSAYTDVMRIPGTLPETGVIADATATNVRIIEGTGSTPSNNTLGALTTNINTLTQSAVGGASAATIDLPSQTLRLGTFGIITAVPGSGSLTVGASTNQGTLTAGGGADNVPGEISINANSANAVAINSVIANNGSGTISLTKAGSGTALLAGTNTFTGPLSITGGKLNVSVIGNGGAASQVGQSPKAGANLLLNGGTLAYTGSTASTDRGFSTGTFGGTLEVPTSTTLTFGSASAAFALGGTLTKTGAGTLRLLDYTGGTASAASDIVINAGAVEFASGYFAGNPFGSQTLTITVNPTGILRTSASHALGGSNLNGGSWGQVFVNGGTIQINGSQYISGGTVNGQGRTVLNGGAITGTADIRGLNSTITTLASATTSTISNAGGISLQYGGITFDVAEGAAAIDLQVSNVMSSTNGVTKTGAGLLVLSGVNTYVGSTTVSAGTLELADNARLRFVIPASGASNKLTGTGTATLKGDFAIDISAAAALTSGTWLLEDATTATYESTFSVVTTAGVPWTDAGSNKWTTPGIVSGTTWTFDEATGTLALSQAGYDSWKTQITNGEDGRTQDADDDGFTNLQEFLFGTNPMASNASLTNTEHVGNTLIIRWRERTSGASYTLLESTTLSNPWTTSIAPVSNDGPLDGDYQPVKATVTIGAGSNFFRVRGVEN